VVVRVVRVVRVRVRVRVASPRMMVLMSPRAVETLWQRVMEPLRQPSLALPVALV
jgi:hypothetical protein